jgi:hypothetical protein
LLDGGSRGRDPKWGAGRAYGDATHPATPLLRTWAAPGNVRGRIDQVADTDVLRPTDAAKGNGIPLFSRQERQQGSVSTLNPTFPARCRLELAGADLAGRRGCPSPHARRAKWRFRGGRKRLMLHPSMLGGGRMLADMLGRGECLVGKETHFPANGSLWAILAPTVGSHTLVAAARTFLLGHRRAMLVHTGTKTTPSRPPGTNDRGSVRPQSPGTLRPVPVQAIRALFRSLFAETPCRVRGAENAARPVLRNLGASRRRTKQDKITGRLMKRGESESGRQPTLALICSPQLLQSGRQRRRRRGGCGAGLVYNPGDFSTQSRR